MRRGETSKGAKTTGLAVVALTLLAALVIGRFIDGRRDRAQQSLVDILHLADQLHEQDAGRWRAAAGSRPDQGTPPDPLAMEAGIQERVRYLGRLGISAVASHSLTLEISRIEGELTELLAAGVRSPSLEMQMSRDVATASIDLDTEARKFKAKVARDDEIIDSGSALALLLPGAAWAVLRLWALRHR